METKHREWKVVETHLSADDVPSEQFLRFYSIFEHCAFLVATIFFIGTTFVILKASTKNMERYKWFLLHEIFWCYLFDISLSLWAVVLLFPYQCGFSVGIMRNTDPHTMQRIIKFVVFCGVGKGYSLFIAFAHRNIQSIPDCVRLRDFYNNTPHLTKYFFTAWLVLELIIVGPIFLVDVSDQVDLKEFLSYNDPIINNIYSREPSTVCYILDSKSSAILGTVLLIITEVLIAFPVIVLNMLYWILKTRHSVTPSTFRIQWMLFIGICIQVLCSYACFFVPIYVGIIIDVLAVPKTPIILCFVACLACCHSVFDCIVIIIFIKPYRCYVRKNLVRFLRFKQLKTSPTPIVTVIGGLELRTITKVNNITRTKLV